MKQYELTVLIHPDLEMNLSPALDKVKNLIETNGGTITKEVNEGKKKTAYPVEKQDFAVYYYYEVDLPAGAPAKISDVLNITDEVLRYLLVSVDERKAKLAKKSAERAAKQAEASEPADKEEE